MKTRSLVLVRTLVCALAAVVAARAQTQIALLSTSQLKRLSVEELLQQEVTSVSRRPEAWATAASNVFLIPEQAPGMIGALTLPDLLRLAPNLFVAQSSAFHWGADSRGFIRTNAHSNKMLVLVDGRSVYSPLYSNVFWNTTDVFLPDLQTIEVMSGPSGSNWGANAVNGVINIQTKSAHDTVGGLVQVSAGTEITQAAVRQGFKFGRNGAMRVYAKRTEGDSSLSPLGADDDVDQWHMTMAGLRADWGDRVTTGEFTVQAEGYTGRFDTRPLPAAGVDGGFLLAKWNLELSPDSNLWARGYYDYVQHDTNGSLTETTHTLDFEIQHDRQLTDTNHLLWGFNYRRILDMADDPVGFAILPAHLWYNVGGAFAQHDLSFARDRLRLTSGVRIEYNHFSQWEVQPSVRLAWRGRQQTAWAAISRATRVPSRLESGFYVPQNPPYFIAGGPDFKAETLVAYELGWRGQVAKGAAVTATGFYHDYDFLRSVELGTPIVQANGVDGRSYGFEGFFDYDVTPAWRLRAGGFAMRQETWVKPGHTDLGTNGQGESSFPDYQLFVRSNFRITPDVDFWVSLRRVGAVPAAEDGGGVVPAYTELDCRLRWQVTEQFELGITGRNLLHKSHPEIGGLNSRREIQRSGFVTATYRY